MLPSIGMHELAWLLCRNVELEIARRIMEKVLSAADTAIEPVIDVDIGFVISTMQDVRDYSDLPIISVAKKLSLPLISFDERLQRRYGKIWRILSHI